MLKSTSNLRAPLWPLKRILANPEAYQKSIELRNVLLPDNFTISKLAALNQEIHDLSYQRQLAATERNSLVKKIKSMVGTKVEQDNLRGELLDRSKQLKDQLKYAQQQLDSMVQVQDEILNAIPNLIAEPTAKVKGEFEEIDLINPREVESHGLSHVEIGSKLGIIDILNGSRVAGSGSYYLIGAGARLEQALIQYALEKCQNWGFTQVSVPHLVRTEFTNACGFRPRDQNDEVQVYSVRGGTGQTDICLAGTAEIPLASWRSHATLENLPQMNCAVSRSFRAEAGARGADTKGLYRVHEFSKVEMFIWTEPDIAKSSATLQQLLGYQKQLVADLELTARVIRLGPTDLGAPAYEKFDIEAWMPGRGSWGEVSSASNCTDFQSRRLWTMNSNNEFVHTLNGTALAVPRIIVALLENNYEPNKNRVRIPRALHKYMPEYIE